MLLRIQMDTDQINVKAHGAAREFTDTSFKWVTIKSLVFFCEDERAGANMGMTV